MSSPPPLCSSALLLRTFLTEETLTWSPVGEDIVMPSSRPTPISHAFCLLHIWCLRLAPLARSCETALYTGYGYGGELTRYVSRELGDLGRRSYQPEIIIAARVTYHTISSVRCPLLLHWNVKKKNVFIERNHSFVAIRRQKCMGREYAPRAHRTYHCVSHLVFGAALSVCPRQEIVIPRGAWEYGHAC